MLALYELLDLLPPKHTPQLPPRLEDLCLFLRDHDKMTEKQAAKKYLEKGQPPKYFNHLKNELKKALVELLVPNPVMGSHLYVAPFEEAYRKFTAYKLLLTKGKRKAAIDVAKNLFPQLQKAEFYTLAHQVAHDLVNHYSAHQIKPDLAKLYKEQADRFFDYIKREALVRSFYSRVSLICKQRESFTPIQITELKEAAKYTLPMLTLPFKIHQVNRLIYTIQIAYHTATAHFDKVLKYCEEALASFPKDHPNIRTLRFSFIHKKIPALIALGKFDEAKEAARESGQLIHKGSPNWHIIMAKRVVVCFHAGDYQEAYEIFKAYQQEGEAESKGVIEFWKMLEGYLYFLIQREKINPYDNEKFYLGKFLNEMPIYSKDKAGLNINILLIQILIRMQRNQYGLLIDKMEALKQYIARYGRSKQIKRANHFIRMIIKLESAHFNRAGAELRTKKWRKKLKDTPLEFGQNLGVEMIPYPVLWEEILTMCDEKFRTSVKTKDRKTREEKRE